MSRIHFDKAELRGTMPEMGGKLSEFLRLIWSPSGINISSVLIFLFYSFEGAFKRCPFISAKEC